MGARRVLLAALLAAVALVGGYLALRPAQQTKVVSGALGGPAPAFSTFDLRGEQVRLRDIEGPVLLNFWASWCTPCREEFPMLARVHGKGVTVLGVVFRDSADSARAFMESQRATWPGLIDPQSRIAEAYDVRQRPGIPVTFAIDAAGTIRGRHLGPLAQEDLDRLLTAIRP